MSKTKEQNAFRAAKRRCLNPNDKDYHNYGGRGIKFLLVSCEKMVEEIGLAPSQKHTLDRIKTNGHYETGNIRWITIQDQQNNKRTNVLIYFNGQTKNITQWEEYLGFPKNSLWRRIRVEKMPVEKALTMPIKKIKLHNYQGKNLNVSEWAKLKNVPRDSLSKRLNKGMSIKDALEIPYKEYPTLRKT